MYRKRAISWFLVIGLLVGWCGVGIAAEQKVVLMIGGKFCEAHLGDVETALKRNQGVKAVDFKSMKGHAVVTIDGEKVMAQQLAEAVNGVKGDGWHCTGQVMK
jgi:copper chaperone CopZ